MKTNQIILIKKDICEIFKDKKTICGLILLPFLGVIAFPYFLIAEIEKGIIGKNLSFVQAVINGLPSTKDFLSEGEKLFYYGVNESSLLLYMIVLLIISLMFSVGIFINEKEKNTLETLLYTPITIKELFFSKVICVFSISMLFNIIIAIAYWSVVQFFSLKYFGILILPTLKWLVFAFFLTPIVLLSFIFFVILVSLKAKSYNEAYQKSSMAVLPITALILSQLMGIVSLNPKTIFIIVIILALLLFGLLKSVIEKVNYENLMW